MTDDEVRIAASEWAGAPHLSAPLFDAQLAELVRQRLRERESLTWQQTKLCGQMWMIDGPVGFMRVAMEAIDGG